MWLFHAARARNRLARLISCQYLAFYVTNDSFAGSGLGPGHSVGHFKTKAKDLRLLYIKPENDPRLANRVGDHLLDSLIC